MISKKLLSLAAASMFGSAAAWAQPTLNSSINPQVGDFWTSHYGTTTASLPGPSGAGQTWNFSNFSETSATTAEYLNCSAAPNCAGYPGSNIVLHQADNDAYAYYKANNNVYALAGYGSAGSGGVNADIIYSDQEDQTRYPLAYNDTYTDSWAVTLTNGGITYNRTGTTTVKADAYGTITTPAGTYTNAMRVYRKQVYQDDFSIGGFTQTINYNADIYGWYTPNQREVVYGYSTITTTIAGNAQTSTAYVYTSSGLGVSNAPAFAANVRTFPNPASGNLTVSFDIDQAEQAAINLQDMTGRTVATVANQGFAAGSHTVSLDVSKLPAAVYALNIRSADGRQTTRRVQVL